MVGAGKIENIWLVVSYALIHFPIGVLRSSCLRGHRHCKIINSSTHVINHVR